MQSRRHFKVDFKVRRPKRTYKMCPERLSWIRGLKSGNLRVLCALFLFWEAFLVKSTESYDVLHSCVDQAMYSVMFMFLFLDFVSVQFSVPFL